MIGSSRSIAANYLLNQHLRTITEEERTTLQDILIEMLRDITSACHTMSVDVILVGGSALGAVRHHGMIPWDDDVDVAMTRDHWNVFKAHFNDLLGEKYEMEAPNYNGQDSKQILAKIYLKDSEYVLAEEMNFPYPNKIFIDVFIIDRVSDNSIVRNFDAMVVNSMRLIAISMLEYKYPSLIMKKIMMSSFFTGAYYYLRRLIGFAFSWCSHQTICDFFDSFVSRHKGEKIYMTIPTGIKRYKGEMLPMEVWLPCSKGEFAGMEINLPHDVDAYLKSLYGDYMKIPPLEKRITHPIVKISFPKEEK